MREKLVRKVGEEKAGKGWWKEIRGRAGTRKMKGVEEGYACKGRWEVPI